MDITILNIIQESTVIPTGLMTFFSMIGHGEFYLVITVYFMWCVDYKRGGYFAIFIAITTLTTESLKLIIQNPRPNYINGIVHDFGMPSAHSSTAVVFFGMLSNFLKKRWVLIGLICIIMIIGVSRIYLNVHYPSQVIIGYALGFLILLFGIKIKPNHKVMLILSLVMMALSFVISFSQSVGYDNLKHVSQVSGLIVGLIYGLYLNRDNGFIINKGLRVYSIKLFSFVVILGLFMAIKTMLKTFLTVNELYIVLNFPLHVILTFSMSGWLPKLFVKLNVFSIPEEF